MRDHQILLVFILDGNIILKDKEIVLCAIFVARLQKVELLDNEDYDYIEEGTEENK